jgi:KaiC/GvpD/RAD55 family RecA-like ATPase
METFSAGFPCNGKGFSVDRTRNANGADGQFAEKALVGALLQRADEVLKFCRERRITAGSFRNGICRDLFRAAERLMLTAGAVASMPEILLEAEKKSGVPFEEAARFVELAPSPALAWKFADEIREIETRTDLQLAVGQCLNDLKAGLPTDVVVDGLKAMAECHASEKAGGPLVTTFPPLTYEALVRMEINPEDHHIAGKGWLRRGAWTLLTGGTGIGKSVLAEQLAACVACGKQFLGLSVSRPFRVLMLTAENDEETLRRDLMAIAMFEKLDVELLSANLQIHHAFALDGPELVSSVDMEVAKGGFDLLILDNYQSYSTGDINDTEAWKSFITPITRILKNRLCAMLLVDHTGKPVERKGWGMHDSVYLAAGTSRKANGARCSAELYSATADDPRYRFHFGKNYERAAVADENGKLVRDIYLDRSKDVSAPFWTPSNDQAERNAIADGDRAVVRYAEKHPTKTIREIAEATGESKSKVDRVLKKYPTLGALRPKDVPE